MKLPNAARLVESASSSSVCCLIIICAQFRSFSHLASFLGYFSHFFVRRCAAFPRSGGGSYATGSRFHSSLELYQHRPRWQGYHCQKENISPESLKTTIENIDRTLPGQLTASIVDNVVLLCPSFCHHSPKTHLSQLVSSSQPGSLVAPFAVHRFCLMLMMSCQ